jgi:hypothetical protein
MPTGASLSDDEACTLRDGGAIVRDECTDVFAYWTVINGEHFIDIGMTDVDAARPLLLSRGYDSG